MSNIRRIAFRHRIHSAVVHGDTVYLTGRAPRQPNK